MSWFSAAFLFGTCTFIMGVCIRDVWEWFRQDDTVYGDYSNKDIYRD